MLTPVSVPGAQTDVLRASALRAAERLPLLSVVLHRALGLLSQGDDVSIHDLSAVIEEDVVIAGSLLSIANSALYSRHSAVASVRRAIARLGVRKTRNVLLGLTVSKCFNAVRLPEPWSSSRFNTHSLAVATLSDLIVQSVASENPEWAFMAGLMHDIGLALIAAGLPEQCYAITHGAGSDLKDAGSDLKMVERERQVLGFTHFDLGGEMLDRWNCPAIVQEAVRFSECSDFSAEPPMSLGAIVKTGTLLADAMGISTFDSRVDARRTTELLETLKIASPAEFVARFKAEHNLLQACAA